MRNRNQLKDNIQLIDLNKLMKYLQYRKNDWENNCRTLESEAEEMLIYGEDHARRYLHDLHYSYGAVRGYEDLIEDVKNNYHEYFFPNLKDL